MIAGRSSQVTPAKFENEATILILPLLVQGEVGAILIAPGEVSTPAQSPSYSCTQALVDNVSVHLPARNAFTSDSGYQTFLKPSSTNRGPRATFLRRHIPNVQTERPSISAT